MIDFEYFFLHDFTETANVVKDIEQIIWMNVFLKKNIDVVFNEIKNRFNVNFLKNNGSEIPDKNFVSVNPIIVNFIDFQFRKPHFGAIYEKLIHEKFLDIRDHIFSIFVAEIANVAESFNFELCEIHWHVSEKVD